MSTGKSSVGIALLATAPINRHEQMGSFSLKCLCLFGALVCAAMYHLSHDFSSSEKWLDGGLSVVKPRSVSSLVLSSTEESVSAVDTLSAGNETLSMTAGNFGSAAESPIDTEAKQTSFVANAVLTENKTVPAMSGSFESTVQSSYSANGAALLIDEDRRPRNLHLAIVGDSVSRFQYIALAHFLHYGQHIRNEDRPAKLSLKDKQLAPGKNDTFHNLHQILLHPNEQCDCYRPAEWTPSVFVDNRYYYDPILNNSLTFLLKYGSMEAHGRWTPQEVHNAHDPSFEEGHYIWEGNWSVAFRHLDAIRPRPNYVVFNAGHHPNMMYKKAVQDDIAESLQELNLIGIYKYTTCKNGNSRARRTTTHEDAMCARMEHRCISYIWTCSLENPGTHYYDHVHLTADMNQRMNEELLDYLRELE